MVEVTQIDGTIKDSEDPEDFDDNENNNDDDADRDDPFDSDVTSEEEEDDLMPERASESAENNVDEALATKMIQEELKQQELEAHELINQELALSGTDALDVVPQKDDSMPKS